MKKKAHHSRPHVKGFPIPRGKQGALSRAPKVFAGGHHGTKGSTRSSVHRGQKGQRARGGY